MIDLILVKAAEELLRTNAPSGRTIITTNNKTIIVHSHPVSRIPTPYGTRLTFDIGTKVTLIANGHQHDTYISSTDHKIDIPDEMISYA
jgi:calcineurin-like phosphoesterase family protein